MSRKLTPRQRRFVEEYLVDRNATQAAIRAGYNRKTAGQQGSFLLKHPQIAAAVAAGCAALSRRVEISQERVLLELARIALLDARRLFDDEGRPLDPRQLDHDVAAAVAGYEVDDRSRKYKLADKVRALDLLGKHLGLYDADNRRQVDTTVEIVRRIVDARGE